MSGGRGPSGPLSGEPGPEYGDAVVVGPIVIVLVLLALVPAFLVAGLVFSVILGWVSTERAEETHAGSELIELNS